MKSSVMEIARALEVLKLALCIQGKVNEWYFRYGEIPLLTNRVDGILEVKIDDNIKRIGVEVISSDDDIDRNVKKLELLINTNAIDEGLVIKMPINEVEQSVMTSLLKVKVIGRKYL